MVSEENYRSVSGWPQLWYSCCGVPFAQAKVFVWLPHFIKVRNSSSRHESVVGGQHACRNESARGGQTFL